jgi:hypothetical protein
MMPRELLQSVSLNEYNTKTIIKKWSSVDSIL